MVTMWQLKMYLGTRPDISKEEKTRFLREVAQFASDSMIASGDVEYVLGMELGRPALREIGHNPIYWQIAIAEINFKAIVRNTKKYPYQCSIFEVYRTSMS